MNPRCPNCGEPISADNDYLTCDECGLAGREACVCRDPQLCDECDEDESGDEETT